MLYRKTIRILICVSVFSSILGYEAGGAPAGGVDLQFSLEPKPVTVDVSGTATDRQTGEPIADALVRGHIVVWRYQEPDLFERCPYEETRTDSQGRYQLRFVTPLTTSGPMKEKDGLCVYVGAPGYETRPRYARPDVTAENTQYHDFDFALERGQLIEGTVVDEDMNPMEGAVVRLQGGENTDWDLFGATGKAVTDESGSFELWIAKGQGRWLSISKRGYGVSFIWDYLERGDLKTIELLCGGQISGTIVDAEGNGIANCEVSVRNYPRGLIDQVFTDSKGKYLLRGVPGDPSIIEFFRTKNGDYREEWGQSDVYARLDPAMNLAAVPQYKILARDGQTVTGPTLVVGTDASVSGRLIVSNSTYGLGGLLVRLDGSWGNMVEADVAGEFRFPFVSPGKHRLTAYLPHNLRYDRGIGRTEIDVVAGRPMKDVEIHLENLAELRVQYLDADGNPLRGITAGATWSRDGSGGWTEGTRSDEDGWAVLYLYPDQAQYVRGFDRSGDLVAEGVEQVEPQAGETLGNLRIVMVPAGRLHGQLMRQDGSPLAAETVECRITFGDGVRTSRPLKTDGAGRFEMDRITPGVIRLTMEIGTVLFNDIVGPAFELRPGETKDLGRVVLKDGIDKEQMIRDKHAHAMENREEIRQAAEQLFQKIRTADYDHFLKDNVHWSSFPIVGYYQTHHWFDVLVKWMCETFRANPITGVELGEVFLNPEEINGRKNLPTVPYRVTLQDGTVLEGNLPFQFAFDGDIPHWHGIHGLDWHLSD